MQVNSTVGTANPQNYPDEYSLYHIQSHKLIVFYIPDCEETAVLRSIVEKHGGIITQAQECFTYQIHPVYEQLGACNFFSGEVIRATWITDSIKQGELLDPDDYKVADYPPDMKGLKRLDIYKAGYTLTEAIKIDELRELGKKQNFSLSASYWMKVEKQGLVPRRTAESLRNFLKTRLHVGLDRFIAEALERKDKFSHMFSFIPKAKRNMPPLTKEENEYIRLAPPKLIETKMRTPVLTFDNLKTHSKIIENMEIAGGVSGNNMASSVAYNLNGLSNGVQRQNQTLDKIFKMIEDSKQQEPHSQDSQNQNKDNDNIPNVKQEELLEAVEREGIIVHKRFEEEKQVSLTSGKEAFFALLASDMLELAAKYKRDVDDVHKLFFEVSCDRDKLIKILEGQKVDRWAVLEDLALKDDPTLTSFKYVVQKKGPEEVHKRKQFLGFE